LVESVIALFEYGFIQRALIAGIIISLAASSLGVFVVLKRFSLIGDTLGHTAFTGIAIGLFMNISHFWPALILTILASLGITKIKTSTRIKGDSILAVLLYCSLALAIVLLSFSNTKGESISNILFGSILLVTSEDLIIIIALSSLTLFTIGLLFKEFMHISLNEDLAKANGLPVNILNYLMNILIAFIIITSMRIVGILIISALLVIPAISALQISKSFNQTILLSMFFGFISVVSGMIAAIILDSAPGGTIVLISGFIFLLTLVWNKYF